MANENDTSADRPDEAVPTTGGEPTGFVAPDAAPRRPLVSQPEPTTAEAEAEAPGAEAVSVDQPAADPVSAT
ncbi:MAG TPA: hypothetical protein VIR58_13535, partial [Acidimicrobiales bacterium]